MTHKGTIYFLCPVNKKPAGGVKQIYRMVDILNKNGYTAFVLHKKKHRESWFKNETSIKINPYIFKKLKYVNSSGKIGVFQKIILFFFKLISFHIKTEDILVYPEIAGDYLDKVSDNRYVIFNQNCYYTFENHSPGNPSPYCSKNNLGTIVVSEDSKKYLQYAFPNLDIYRIYLGIDEQLFKSSIKKKKQICYMPRKLQNDIQQVISLLQQKESMKTWELVSIENKSEEEVAQILQESVFFLSFNHREGFGLPPVEAMLCGTYVIGYTGQGGREYFRPYFSSPIENENILDFVETIDRMIKTFETTPEAILQKTEDAKKLVAECYNFLKEEESTLNAWNNLLKKN